MLQPDGALDRAAMAKIVFSDPERRAALERIVHPLVGARSHALIEAAPEGAVVVYDVPLLAETMHTTRLGGHDFDAVVVVEAPRAVRVRRLVARGVPDWDAEARIASQASDEERRALADHVITNDGTLADLQDAGGRGLDRADRMSRPSRQATQNSLPSGSSITMWPSSGP